MNEDDEGSIYICEPHFKRTENGVNVRYYWSKLALSKANEIGDEDYVPNEEEKYYQEEKQEQEENPKRQRLEQSIELRRSPRNLKRINYEGMDMNEDDQGEFKISKRMLDDGELIHYWVSVPLSQVNEYDDEDYNEEI